MYKLCKTEQSAMRQRQLEKALLTAMQVSRYEDINISELCQRMQVPRKSFYRYFSGKDGALHALIDHTLMEHETYAAINRTEGRTVVTELEQYFMFWLEHKDLLDALARSGISNLLIERSIRHAIDEMAFPTRLLPEESKVMQRHVLLFAVSGLTNAMLQWHREGFRESVAEMAKVAQRLLTKPLFSGVDKLL